MAETTPARPSRAVTCPACGRRFRSRWRLMWHDSPLTSWENSCQKATWDKVLAACARAHAASERAARGSLDA